MRSILFIIILIIISIAIGLNWIFSFDKYPLKKETTNDFYSSQLRAKLPHRVTEAGGTVCNNKFYLLGGIGPFTQSFSDFYCYSPETDTWDKKKDFPHKINHPGIAAFEDKIYVVGGFDPIGLRIRGFMFADWKPRAELYIYDTKTDQWSKGKEMPTARGAGGVCAHQGYIYYCGGIDENKKISSSFYRYNIETKEWLRLPNMPTARDHLRIEAVGNSIYAISGRKDDLRFNLNVVEAYNIETGEWSTKANIPFARGGFGSCTYMGKIYTFGGEYTWRSLSNVEEYNPSTDQWKVLPDLPEPRHGICAGVIGEDIHLVSGGLRPRISVSNVHRVLHLKQ